VSAQELVVGGGRWPPTAALVRRADRFAWRGGRQQGHAWCRRALPQGERWMSGSLNASTGVARPEGATAAAADVPRAADGPELPVRSSRDGRRRPPLRRRTGVSP